VKPRQFRFAIQPAGLSQARSCFSLSPDGSKRAITYSRGRDFGDLDFNKRASEFGAYVELTQVAPERSWTWRVGPGDAPPVAFSPDGTKLASVLQENERWEIGIWEVPK
jgi:hypothetical protein